MIDSLMYPADFEERVELHAEAMLDLDVGGVSETSVERVAAVWHLHEAGCRRE